MYKNIDELFGYMENEATNEDLAIIVKAVNSFDSLVNALKVISYDAKISAWLGENDPKALVQVRQAIANATK